MTQHYLTGILETANARASKMQQMATRVRDLFLIGISKTVSASATPGTAQMSTGLGMSRSNQTGTRMSADASAIRSHVLTQQFQTFRNQPARANAFRPITHSLLNDQTGTKPHASGSVTSGSRQVAPQQLRLLPTKDAMTSTMSQAGHSSLQTAHANQS